MGDETWEAGRSLITQARRHHDRELSVLLSGLGEFKGEMWLGLHL